MSGAPNDPRLLCSRSRAHHAPYFRLRSARGNPHCRHASLPERRIWDARLAPARSCIICHVIASCKPCKCACPGPVGRSGKSCTGMAVSGLKRRSQSHWSRGSALLEIQMDFKDVSSVLPEPRSEGKHKHVVEVCNFVDAGTSIALWARRHGKISGNTPPWRR
jgi:hypothetical protein